MKSPTSPRSFAPTQLALVTEHRNIKQEVSSAPSSRFVSVFLKLFFSPSPCNGNRCKIRRPNPKDLPLVVFAREFSGLAVLTGFDDATLNSLFWIRANYHRPVDLTDTTGLCWREGILRCLESVRPLIQNLSIVKPAGRSTVKDADRSEVKPAGTLKSSGRSAVSSKPAGQRGLLFTSSAQRGLLFLRPAQRGLLFPCPAQRVLLFTSSAQRGLLFLRPAQRGLLFPCPAQRGLLFRCPAQRGLLLPCPAQIGLLFPCPAQRGVLFPGPAQRGSLFLRLAHGGPQNPKLPPRNFLGGYRAPAVEAGPNAEAEAKAMAP